MSSQHQVSISRSFVFDAAHILSWHPGKCSRLHGHTYRLEVSVRGDLDERGIVIDFDEMASIVENLVLNRIDHSFLNDILDNPTSERVALHILELLESCPFKIDSLKLWEGIDSFVEIRP